MIPAIDPSQASMDQLIDRIRQLRRQSLDSPLTEHLLSVDLETQLLVDLACIDLMERRRLGSTVRAEDYVKEFDCLRDPSHQLDLLDAEICVDRELNIQVDVDQIAARFPSLANQIRELVQLDVQAALPIPGPAVAPGRNTAEDQPASPMGIESSELIDSPSLVLRSFDRNKELAGGQTQTAENPIDQNAGSSAETKLDDPGSPSLDILSRERSAPSISVTSISDYPIEVPEWFVSEQCVASGPGRWLIRGRDSVRGGSLALKITALPTQLSGAEADQILDACEAASRVRNPGWVLPSVAAIQSRHLGVIRPWVHARPWLSVGNAQSQEVLLRRLSSVAFCLASAHQVDATHGGVHPENLLVDHDDSVHVLDGASSHAGMNQWILGTPSTQHIMSVSQRKFLDAQDFIKLVAAASVDWEPSWSQALLKQLREINLESTSDPCGAIGQILVSKASSLNDVNAKPLASSRSWRSKLTRWLNQDN